MLSSLRILVNQIFSRFSLIAQLRSEQRGALFQSSKRNAAHGTLPRPRDVWSVHSKLMHKGRAFMRLLFEKAGETFNLLTALVNAQ